MADSALSSPLLSSSHSSSDDDANFILNIPEDNLPQPSDRFNCNGTHSNRVLISFDEANPFGFLGATQIEVPESTTVDPFRNNTPRIEGLYEWLKIVVLSPIALLRLVLFGLCLMVGYMATVVALHGWKDKDNPMPKWRCRLMWVTRISARWILFSFGYQWINRKGRPAPREIAPIVVSNHVSYIDPIFFFYELFPTIVASESHDSMPFVGTIIRAMQVIYVNRFSRSSRRNAVNEIKKYAFEDLNTEKGLF